MNDDELLLERCRNVFTKKSVVWIEKKMMGGVCFMVDDKMCIGTFRGDLMARVNPTELEALRNKKGADFMKHGGRASKSFLSIEATEIASDKSLEFWIGKCLEYNPLAKSSKKKKKK